MVVELFQWAESMQGLGAASISAVLFEGARGQALGSSMSNWISQLKQSCFEA